MKTRLQYELNRVEEWSKKKGYHNKRVTQGFGIILTGTEQETRDGEVLLDKVMQGTGFAVATECNTASWIDKETRELYLYIPIDHECYKEDIEGIYKAFLKQLKLKSDSKIGNVIKTKRGMITVHDVFTGNHQANSLGYHLYFEDENVDVYTKHVDAERVQFGVIVKGA